MTSYHLGYKVLDFLEKPCRGKQIDELKKLCCDNEVVETCSLEY